MTAAVALLALVLSGVAQAQQPGAAASEADVARARELFENGQMLYQEGRYEDAITAWEESYRLSGYTDLLYNISGAHERLGNYRAAIDALNKYRVYAKADERDTLDRRIRALEERLAQAPKPVTTPVVTTPVVTPVETTTTLPPPDDGKGFPVFPALLIGTGAIGLGAGGVFALQAGTAMEELRGSCVDQEGGLLCPDSAQGASDQRDQAARISTVGFIAGGVLAAAGLTMLVVGGGDSSDVSVSVAPTVWSGVGQGPGVVLGGKF